MPPPSRARAQLAVAPRLRPAQVAPRKGLLISARQHVGAESETEETIPCWRHAGERAHAPFNGTFAVAAFCSQPGA